MNWKNILLTAIAVLMLVGLAVLTPSPVMSNEAYDSYQSLDTSDEE